MATFSAGLFAALEATGRYCYAYRYYGRTQRAPEKGQRAGPLSSYFEAAVRASAAELDAEIGHPAHCCSETASKTAPGRGGRVGFGG